MKRILIKSNYEPILFISGLLLFSIAAILGWIKLKYGFNFIDEGYYMTESWRLASGDHFLHDKLTGALRHYTLLNSIIFKLAPGITLLGFRQLQFFLTIGALALFSVALWRLYHEYWYLPFIFSIFAFTGLDPVGMMTNLSYQTYPHLFITLFLAFFLFGIEGKTKAARYILFYISGMCLWGMSLCLLHTSTIIAAPVLLYILSNKLMDSKYSFSFGELMAIMAPFFLLWGIFIWMFSGEYINNVRESINLMLSTPSHSSGAMMRVTGSTLALIIIAMAYASALHIIFKIKNVLIIIGSLGLLSLLTYIIIKTSFWHILPIPLLGPPTYCSSFLIVLVFLFWASIAWKLINKKSLIPGDQMGILLMVPASILAITLDIFSALGNAIVLEASIPIVAGLYIWWIGNSKVAGYTVSLRLLILVLLLIPFYLQTALFDWKFTFFDVIPSQATVTIEQGFGKGIKTNELYKSLYEWIRGISQNYTKENDYIISFVTSPMVHMITKRKPSLDDTFVALDELPPEYFQREIEFMKGKHRQPKMVFLFDRMFCLLPVAGELGSYTWMASQYDLQPNNPIGEYIKNNMFLIDQFQVDKDLKILCFVDNPIDPAIKRLTEALKNNTGSPELNSQLGKLYAVKKDYVASINAYRKALTMNPRSIDILDQLGRINAMAGKNEDAIEAFKKVVELKPDKTDAYYNLACVYSKMEKKNEALQSLEKAVHHGFSDCRLLKEDQDLNNIRGSEGFRGILMRKCPD